VTEGLQDVEEPTAVASFGWKSHRVLKNEERVKFDMKCIFFDVFDI